MRIILYGLLSITVPIRSRILIDSIITTTAVYFFLVLYITSVQIYIRVFLVTARAQLITAR